MTSTAAASPIPRLSRETQAGPGGHELSGGSQTLSEPGKAGLAVEELLGFPKERCPPRAGTALGAGSDRVPLQLEGSRGSQPEVPHNIWAALSQKHSQRSRGGQQGRKAALHSNSPLHQASHRRLRSQLLPGDARAEGHQIPPAAGEDPGEHPEQFQRPLSPAGSGSCHGPGQCQHQRVQTAPGSG